MKITTAPMRTKNFIEWSNELSVGIQEIDEQHKILVDLLNKSYQTIISMQRAEVVNKILSELTLYTKVHFAIEESLLRIFDYPQYSSHKSYHQELLDRLESLQDSIKKKEDSTEMGVDVIRFLIDWLVYHISEEDKKYAVFLLKNGLQPKWPRRNWATHIWRSPS